MWMLIPGQTIERLVVEEAVGRGSSAEVYRVRHLHLGTHFALKLLTVTSTSLRDRLIREGRVQAALRHPNIVAVHDVLEVDGHTALLMEYVAGPSLEGWLRGHRPTLREADTLARGILAAVSAAHAQGVLHRDLKPANVMLAHENGAWVPKVTDFGLAKIMDEVDGARMTRSGAGMGTPAYLAPEQANEAHSVDERADVFSLGAILYEVCCGQRAFPGASIVSILTRAATGRFQPPRDLCPDLPPPWERAVLGALQPDQATRVPSCAALLDIWTDREPAVPLSPLAPARGEPSRLPSPLPADAEPTDTLHAVQAALARGGRAPPTPPPSLPPPAAAPADSQGERSPVVSSADTAFPPDPPRRAGLWVATLLLAAGVLTCGGLLAWRIGRRPAALPPEAEATPPLPDPVSLASLLPAEPAGDPAARIQVAIFADPPGGQVTVAGQRGAVGQTIEVPVGLQHFRFSGPGWSGTCAIEIDATVTRVEFFRDGERCLAYR